MEFVDTVRTGWIKGWIDVFYACITGAQPSGCTKVTETRKAHTVGSDR